MDDNTRKILTGLREDKAYLTLVAVAVISKEKPAMRSAHRRLPWIIAAIALCSAALPSPVRTLLRDVVESWSTDEVKAHR